MMKQASRIPLYGGLGLSLALLVTWIIGPSREAASVAQESLPAFPSGTPSSARSIEPSESRARPPNNGEPPEADGTGPLGRSIPVSASGTHRYESAAPGDLAADVVVTRDVSASSNLDERTARESSVLSDAERPSAWCLLSTLDHHFQSDSTTVYQGARSVVIGRNERVLDQTLRVNALWQAVYATPYRGSRIEVSVQANSRGGAHLFLHVVTQSELTRADGRTPAVPTAVRYYPQLGTGWTRLSIVGEVPLDAAFIYFGFGNNGAAPLWLDNAVVAEVGAQVPVTETPRRGAYLVPPVGTFFATPLNLDFEFTNVDIGAGAGTIPQSIC